MPSAPFTTRAMFSARRVQNRMPANVSVSPRIVTCVRWSLSTVNPLAASAAGMSRSSSWLPRTANTPCGA